MNSIVTVHKCNRMNVNWGVHNSFILSMEQVCGINPFICLSHHCVKKVERRRMKDLRKEVGTKACRPIVGKIVKSRMKMGWTHGQTE